MFANDLIDAIGAQSERAEESRLGSITEDQSLTFNVQINMGNERFFTTIEQGIENRQILIDERSLVKR
jgi:hypothetical protein